VFWSRGLRRLLPKRLSAEASASSEYNPHLHFQEILVRSSLPCELIREKCRIQAWSTTRHNKHLRRQRIPSPSREPCMCPTKPACQRNRHTKEGKPPRNEKDEGKREVRGESKKPRHVLALYKNRSARLHLVA
jgi:hypothetical protein